MKILIVAYNFKSSGEKALDYARSLVSAKDEKITLLYIAKDEQDRQHALARFAQMKTKMPENTGFHAATGNLVEDLTKEAVKLKGDMVVMAIRDESGFQKLFGSTALKVITDSPIPFLTLQDKKDKPPLPRFRKIAMTLDGNEESIQVLSSAVMLCERSGAGLVLLAGKNPDPSQRQKIDANIERITRSLKTTGVPYELVYLPAADFTGELIRYSKLNSVDLITVTYYKNNSTLFPSNFVQQVLENEAAIPVLAIGGRELPAFQKLFSNVVCPVSIDKIDSNVSRLTIFLNVILMAVFLFTYQPVYALIVAGDYFIRAALNSKFSPIGFISRQVTRLLNLKPKRISLAPKVFASRLGFLCALAAVVFYYYNMYYASVISMGMLAVLSFMDSVLNFCVGCMIYYYLVFPLFKTKIR